MSKVHVLHENSPWVEPLRAAFAELGHSHEEWFLDQGCVPLDEVPPRGVFYNRMSASSHTRDHRHGPELTHGVLNWLEGHGRRTVNGSRALYLEVSKIAQYTALRVAGITTPRTIAAVGRDRVIEAVDRFGAGPWILKPNRGGKGLGVRLFDDRRALTAYLDGPGGGEEAPIDGLWLVQQYVRASRPCITRAEFVGGKFLYAVEVDTSDGFELCPADACNVSDAFCPGTTASAPRFRIDTQFSSGHRNGRLIDSYERFLAANAIEIAGIEFIRDGEGKPFTYDINTNTNYNAAAEAEAGVPVSGMRAVARFLLAELHGQDVGARRSVAAE